MRIIFLENENDCLNIIFLSKKNKKQIKHNPSKDSIVLFLIICFLFPLSFLIKHIHTLSIQVDINRRTFNRL